MRNLVQLADGSVGVIAAGSERLERYDAALRP